jgi:hypothetical protein
MTTRVSADRAVYSHSLHALLRRNNEFATHEWQMAAARECHRYATAA